MYSQEDKYYSLDRSHDLSFNKLQHMQDQYDERLSSLSKQIQIFFSSIEKDEIFKAMQENSLSQEFASQRARELLVEILKSEQEDTISRLQNELAEFKNLNSKLDYDKQKLANALRETEEKLRRSEIEKEKLINDCNNVAVRVLGC